MSGLGMLASAIGGGSAAVGQQAAGDIEQGRRMDMAREQAAIQEQMQMRLAENHERIKQAGGKADFAFANDRANVATRQATTASDVTANSKVARAVKVDEFGDAAYQGAVRKQADTDASEKARRERDAIKAMASDPNAVKANWTVLMSDPRIKGAYTASLAAAGASGAETQLRSEQFNQLVQVGTMATQLRTYQTQLSALPATETAKREEIQQRISDLGFAGKDPAKFLSLAEKAQDNVTAALRVMMDPMADDATKASAKLQMERATELSTKAATMGGVKLAGSFPVPVAAAIAQLKRNPGESASFDEMFGKGAAAKALASGATTTPTPPAKKATGMLAVPTEVRTPDSAEARALDAARLAADIAKTKLSRFGSSQKQRDPEGFKSAQAEFDSARAARQAAEEAYRATLTGVGAAFRYSAQ